MAILPARGNATYKQELTAPAKRRTRRNASRPGSAAGETDMNQPQQAFLRPEPRTSDPEALAREIVERLTYRIGKDPKVAKPHDWLQAAILVDARPRHRALDAVDPRHLRGRREARLLPQPRVPDRPADARRRLEPRADRADARGAEGARRRLRRHRRARARRGARQRRPRAAGGLLHGEHGDRRHPRLWLRHPLPPRAVPPGDRRRLPGRAARDLARARQPVGVRPARERLRDRLRRLRRVPRRQRRGGEVRLEAGRAGHRHRLRHADRRLARRRG